MLKKYPFLKWSLISISSLILIIVLFGFWFMSLLSSSDESKTNMAETVPQDLPYLTKGDTFNRGKILAVVTSSEVMGDSGKSTGYELTELSRTYYVLEANGFEVEIASPMGGLAPVVIDNDDMGPFDYAFLNDTEAQHKSKNTIPLENIDSNDYQGVFFLGGKGAMFDFPQNNKIQEIVREHYESQKVIGAICHGPAALVNVKLSDGTYLLSGKTVSGFTNDEELLLIPNARKIFPFLLEDEIVSKGARINKGNRYLNTVSQDGNLITGQNPWSTWSFAETMVSQLGYEPKMRKITPEENTVQILITFRTAGYDEAKEHIRRLIVDEKKTIDRNLLAMHGIVASMDWKFNESVQLVRLLSYAKRL